MNRAVFLDRDNTLIHNDGDLGNPDEVRLIQGAASAIASLRGLGYRIVVVSNQGGVARGKFTEAEVEACNARLNELVKTTSSTTIDRFYYCPYHPQGTVEKYRREHPWRKPQPGMLLQAQKDMQLDMAQSWMVGDQERDIEAGAAAGARTILLTPEASIGQPPLLQDRVAAQLMAKSATPTKVKPDFVARNLIEAVRIIAQQRRPEGVEDWRGVEQDAASLPRPTPVAMSPATARLTQNTHRDGGSTSAATPDRVSIPQPGPTPPLAVPKIVHPPTTPSLSGASGSDSSTLKNPTPAASSPTPDTRRPTPAPSSPTPVSAASPAPTASMDQTLRQILQELRNQRHTADEFSWGSVLAIVLQMVALLCLVGALFISHGSDAGFLRWLGVGLLVQLATIALLLFRK